MQVRKVRDVIIYNIGWLIIVGMLIGGRAFIPGFFVIRNLINILFHSSILGMLVLAESVCLISGQLDLSIESTLAFSVGIASLWMTQGSMGVSGLWGIAITVLVGLLIGAANGVCVVKLRIHPFLMTLAVLIILRGLMLYLIPRTIFGLPKDYVFIGSARILTLPLPIFLFLGMYGIFHGILRYTPFGRALYATGGSTKAAFAVGISTDKVLVASFVISGFLASLAGLIMAGRMQAVTNGMGEGMVFLALAGAIIGGVSLKGGVGTAFQAFCGVIILGMIDNMLVLSRFSPYLVYAVKGFLVLVAIVIDSFRQRIS
ncbi:ABC transporter permease [Candidatus Aerophobetes bacterium]|uniref:Autoinducer 2 import system permease protein LsrD n=1 Tax=Aerophobetes bacterium TaxID=2030807 RepID=A0A523S3M8_UNCAE|nr:MAG: ABC transporter permease [Candidatus Aerophobetes bacterium]